MNFFSVLLPSLISCLVSFVLGGALTFFAAKCKGVFKRERALEEGLKCLLRSKLIDFHEKYTERGYCPIYVKEAARRSYEAYHNLGGNGVVTKLFRDLMELPETDPVDLSDHADPAEADGNSRKIPRTLSEKAL